MPMAGGIGEKDTNLAVLDAPSRAGVLAMDAGRLGAFLEKARLIQHQDRIVIAQVLDHIGPQVIAECLGEVPAVLPLQGSQQALKISQGASARLRAPKLRGNPPSNRLQLLSPVLGFAPARHGTAPPPPQAEQRAKPGCSTRAPLSI